MIKNLINDYLNSNIKNKDSVAILFSGGMDSLSILLSCLELGIKPKLYTFYLDSHISDDLKRSRDISKIYNLELEEIKIETSKVNLLEDIAYIIKKYKTNRKTAVQCIHPFLYIIPNIKEEYVLTGLCADDLFGTPRSVAKHSKNHEVFTNIRKAKFEDYKSSSYKYIKEMCLENNKKIIAPYKESIDIYNYMISLTYKEMHSPKQKNIIYQDYREEIIKNSIYRRNSNLQCDSKIREWHDSLLMDEDINYKNFKSVTGIYNQIFNSFFKHKEE